MLDRRSFNKMLVAGATVSMVACSGARNTRKKGQKTVVVVGGGFGGATAAKYIKKFGKEFHVILVEQNETYYTCPFSNMVLAGEQDLASIGHSYSTLESKYGIEVIHAKVSKVDAANKTVNLENGKKISYDKAVVAPGIDFKYDSIKGNTEEASESGKIPHAYKAGKQTQMLRDQLVAMKDNGTVVVIPPENPFRCPPGPYERVALIAYYLKKHKPKAKIIVLDPKNKFSKFGLFRAGWKKHYTNIDWRAGNKGGRIKNINVDSKTIKTKAGKTIKADVINLIPNQKAGKLAFASGLTKGDWCPINPMTFESTIHSNVYVCGDSSIAKKMPKSGFSANSQAKVMALQIVRTLRGKVPMSSPKFANTCYSLITPDHAISVTASYTGTSKLINKDSGGLSPMGATDAQNKDLSIVARNWYKGITTDMFG